MLGNFVETTMFDGHALPPRTQVSMSKVCSDDVKPACGVGRAIGEPDLHKWNHGHVSVISHGYMHVYIYIIYMCVCSFTYVLDISFLYTLKNLEIA